MQDIFDDEWRLSGEIWSNPFGTRHNSPLDIVAKGLKWPTLRRLSRLASNKLGRAGTTTLSNDWI